MAKILASILAALGIGAASPPSQPPSEGPSADLRSMALHLSPDQIGLTPKTYPHKVWGTVMETGIDSGFYTLFVLGDGTTSLYFSTGGGVIGAGEHSSVRAAAGEFLTSANLFAGAAEPTKFFPPPANGQTTFYFLTFDGPKKYSAPEQSLGEGTDKLSDLFHAGHAVIAAVRQASP
jgi:hypothetical protein